VLAFRSIPTVGKLDTGRDYFDPARTLINLLHPIPCYKYQKMGLIKNGT
jgi:hypothetical protein